MKAVVNISRVLLVTLLCAVGVQGESCIEAKGIALPNNCAAPSPPDLTSLDCPGIQGLLAVPVANFVGRPAVPSVVEVAIHFGLQLETPLQFFIEHAVDVSRYHVQTHYHPTALDVFGNRRTPICDNDAALLKAHARLADAIATSVSLIQFFTPMGDGSKVRASLETSFAAYGLGEALTTALDEHFDGCSNMELPWGLGKCAAMEFSEFLMSDHFGWNVKGTSGGCTANCRPYSDFSIDGYSPYKPKQKSPFSWKPLLETSGRGYFTRQEHVTPHIGFTSKIYGQGSREEQCKWLKSKKMKKPNYDYDEELRYVLEQTARLAEDDVLKMQVEAYDSKLTSIFVQGNIYARTIRDRDDPLLDFKYAQYGAFLGAASHNALVLVWREKVLQDLLRPTTLAEREDESSTIVTYAGPFQGLQEIAVKDWEPYIRTMPHAEYPSGSSCICEAFREFSIDYFGTDVLDPEFADATTLSFPAGSSKVEPGVTPSEDLTFTYTSFSEIAEVCGKSRTDGGMHFSKSVAGGVELCSGIGPHVAQLAMLLEAGVSAGRLIDPKDAELAACPKRSGSSSSSKSRPMMRSSKMSSRSGSSSKMPRSSSSSMSMSRRGSGRSMSRSSTMASKSGSSSMSRGTS